VWEKAPEAGEFARIFVSKVLLITASYRKKWGAGCTSCSPNNFVGATAPPVSAPMYTMLK